MIKLNLTATNRQQEKVLKYLQENVSETLADKINNGTPFEKDGQPLLNKKTLSGFMRYAGKESRKFAEQGEQETCVDDDDVYGWAIHYFEEDSIEETLYTVDGEKYKPPVKVKQTTVKTPYTPTYTPKQENKQSTLFDMLSAEPVAPKLDAANKQKEKNLQSATEIVATASDPAIVENNNEKIHPKTSPFYISYSELKEKYPDCVIAYRLGDFYEILGKDAVTIATELDLTLTSRDCGLPHRIPIIGFPYHAADNYVAKIIDRGHKIAVVEKSDDINILPQKICHTVDEETGEILSGYEMRKFDDDIEEPENIDDITDSDIPDEQTDNTLAEEKAFAKAFDSEVVCRLSELLGDCFILA